MKNEEFLTRLSELPEIVSRIKSSSFISGQHKPIFISGGTEFENSAPLNYGDDAKNYSYRLSARIGKPMKKIMKEEKDSRCFCLIDSGASMLLGATRTKLDFAFEIGTILGLTAIEMDDQAGLMALPISDLPIRRSGTRSKAIFMNEVAGSYLLSCHNRNQTDNIADSINELATILPVRSTICLISDWMFQTSHGSGKKPLEQQEHYRRTRDALEAMAIKRDVVIVSVQDIVDILLPKGLWRLHSFDSKPVSITGGRSQHQQVLGQLHQERKSWFNDLYNNLGIDYCELMTTDEFDHIPELIAFFAQRKSASN